MLATGSALETVEETLRNASSGWKPFPKEVQKLVAERLFRGNGANGAQWPLTHSQHEIALLLAMGFSDKQIAAFRGTARGTVHTLISRMFKKLGVHNRFEAVRLLLGISLDFAPRRFARVYSEFREARAPSGAPRAYPDLDAPGDSYDPESSPRPMLPT